MQSPDFSTVPAQAVQQNGTTAQSGVGAVRQGAKIRTLAELMSAAMCRGDDAAVLRYWAEYRAMVGAA